jgi:hypothetical protein
MAMSSPLLPYSLTLRFYAVICHVPCCSVVVAIPIDTCRYLRGVFPAMQRQHSRIVLRSLVTSSIIIYSPFTTSSSCNQLRARSCDQKHLGSSTNIPVHSPRPIHKVVVVERPLMRALKQHWTPTKKKNLRLGRTKKKGPARASSFPHSLQKATMRSVKPSTFSTHAPRPHVLILTQPELGLCFLCFVEPPGPVVSFSSTPCSTPIPL